MLGCCGKKGKKRRFGYPWASFSNVVSWSAAFSRWSKVFLIILLEKCFFFLYVLLLLFVCVEGWDGDLISIHTLCGQIWLQVDDDDDEASDKIISNNIVSLFLFLAPFMPNTCWLWFSHIYHVLFWSITEMHYRKQGKMKIDIFFWARFYVVLVCVNFYTLFAVNKHTF